MARLTPLALIDLKPAYPEHEILDHPHFNRRDNPSSQIRILPSTQSQINLELVPDTRPFHTITISGHRVRFSTYDQTGFSTHKLGYDDKESNLQHLPLTLFFYLQMVWHHTIITYLHLYIIRVPEL